jgi:membrane protein implicated in regulation of membrane protease activity
VDTLETFFLACFGFGALFTVGSLVLGMAGGIGHGVFHAGGGAHIHGGSVHGGGAHLHGGAGHAHAGSPGHAGPVVGQAHATHAAGHAGADIAGHAGHGQASSDVAGQAHVGSAEPAILHAFHALPLLNPSSALGFLTWFGAAGYLLVRYANWALWAVLLGALLAGAISGYLIARFLGLILAGEREMDPADYRLEGTLGRISVSVPAGGTGEVIFSKVGARRSEAARGLGGRPIARGTEVVITAYADGFAIVQPWDEFIEKRQNE